MEWSTISGAFSDAWSVVTSCLTNISNNALLVVMLVCGTVLPMGFKLFKKAKRAVK